MFPVQGRGGQSAQPTEQKNQFAEYIKNQIYGRAPVNIAKMASDYASSQSSSSFGSSQSRGQAQSHQSSMPYPAAGLLDRSNYPGQHQGNVPPTQLPTNSVGLLKTPYNYPSSVSPSEDPAKKYPYPVSGSDKSQNRGTGTYESPEPPKTMMSPAERAQRDLRLKQHCEGLLRSSSPLTSDDLMFLYDTLQQTPDLSLSAELENLITMILQQKAGLNVGPQGDTRSPEKNSDTSLKRRDPYEAKGSQKSSYPSKDAPQEAYKKTSSFPTHSEKYSKELSDTRQTKSPMADLDSLSGAVVSLGVEVHGLKKQLQAKTEESLKLSEMIGPLNTRIFELETQLNNERLQTLQMNKTENFKINDLEDKLKKLTMIKDGFVTQVKCMSQSLKEEKDKTTKFQVENARMEVQTKQNALLIENLKDKITKLEAEIVRLNTHEKTRLAQIDGMTKLGHAEREKFAKIEQQMARISENHGKRVDELNRTILSTKEKCLILQIENAKLKHELAQLKKTDSPQTASKAKPNKYQIETIEIPDVSFIEPENPPQTSREDTKKEQKLQKQEPENLQKQEPKVLQKQEPQKLQKQEPKNLQKQEPKILQKQEPKILQKQEPPAKVNQKNESSKIAKNGAFIQDGSQVPEVSSTGSSDQVSDVSEDAKKRKLPACEEEPKAKKPCDSGNNVDLPPEISHYSENKTMENWLHPDITKLSKVFEKNPEHYYKIVIAAKDYYKTFILEKDVSKHHENWDEKRKFIVGKLTELNKLIKPDEAYFQQILLEFFRFCMLLNWNSPTNWRSFYSVEKASVGLRASICHQYNVQIKELIDQKGQGQSKDSTTQNISLQTESSSEKSSAKVETGKTPVAPDADQPKKDKAAVNPETNENLNLDEKAASPVNSDSSDDVIFVGEVDNEANISYALDDLQLDIEEI